MSKKIFERFTYLLFRLVYTTTHLAAYRLMKASWEKRPRGEQPQYLIVCGAEYENEAAARKLGAFRQWAAERHPGKPPVLFSKLVQSETMESPDRMRQVPWEWQTRARLLGPLFKILFSRARFFGEAEIHRIASMAYAMYDLGEHQISSDRPTGWTANALANIVFACRYRIPFVMGPQIFGPFRYRPRILNGIYRAMIREMLPYPAVIGAADGESLARISPFTDRVVRASELPEFLDASERFLRSPKVEDAELRPKPDR